MFTVFNMVIVPREFSARKCGALEIKKGLKALGQNVQPNLSC